MDDEFGRKRRSHRRSRRGNPQAAKAMKMMRKEGISLKEAWARVQGRTSRKMRRRSRKGSRRMRKMRRRSRFGMPVIPGL